MKKILFNFSNIKIGGGIQVAHSLLNIIKEDKDIDFIAVLSTNLFNEIKKNINSYNFNYIVYDIKANIINTIFSYDTFLDNLIKKHNINIVFTLFGPSYWRPKVKHICGYAKPQYIYKDSPFFKIISTKERIIISIKEFFHLLDFRKNAEVLITENPDVTCKISTITGKKSYTVTNYYNQIFDTENKWKRLTLPEFEGKYLLTISANYPHKNLNIIPLVVEELLKRRIKRYKFVVTIEKGNLKSSKLLDDYIVYVGKININQCPSLYQQSEYMFLPTLLECFSASYAEAMRMEKIILTSNIGSAISICKDSAIYFDPLNAKDIVQKLLDIESDSEMQEYIIKKGKERLKKFDSYRQRAEKYKKIITEQ